MENKTMKFKVEIIASAEGKTIAEGLQKTKEFFKNFNVTDIKPYSDLRTNNQNRSLHLWFTQVSDELNANGITAQQIFSQPVEHFWTPELVKEMWRKIQRAMFGKKSTTKLKKTEQIDKIYDVFNKVISERAEIQCPPFPSIETMMLKDNEKIY